MSNLPSKPDKSKLLTPMQNLFLEYLGGEAKGDIRTAMTMAGYSPNTSQQEVIRSLRNEIREVAEMLLATLSVKAVHALDTTLDSPNRMGAGNATNAANSILDRVGMGKKEDKPTVITVQPIFFLPEKRGREGVTINGTVNNSDTAHRNTTINIEPNENDD